jgi:hypothetical protein
VWQEKLWREALYNSKVWRRTKYALSYGVKPGYYLVQTNNPKVQVAQEGMGESIHIPWS